MNRADLIIVGGGIAGLHVGIESLRKGRAGLRVLILEKYDYMGGRVVTHYKGGKQWEIGAGRIHKSHKMVRGLMQRYGLHWYEQNSTSAEWRGIRNTHKDLFEIFNKLYIYPLHFLPNETLANHTVRSLLEKIKGKAETEKILIQYPYRAEVDDLRADMALKTFQKEMGTWKGFGSCREGLSAIIHGMREEFEALGGKILMNTEVIDVVDTKNNRNGKSAIVITKDGKELFADAVVLALHRDAVAALPSWRSLDVLKKTVMRPLLRMYAVFPKNANGKMWFDGVPKTITDAPIRFIIPVNYEKGIIMISYTDARDAQKWIEIENKKGRQEVMHAVMDGVRRLFRERQVPDPIEFKTYPWTNGCTYWLPGNYDVVETSRNAHTVGERVFMCGESWSLRQAWIEGALEHAEELMKVAEFKKYVE